MVRHEEITTQAKYEDEGYFAPSFEMKCIRPTRGKVYCSVEDLDQTRESGLVVVDSGRGSGYSKRLRVATVVALGDPPLDQRGVESPWPISIGEEVLVLTSSAHVIGFGCGAKLYIFKGVTGIVAKRAGLEPLGTMYTVKTEQSIVDTSGAGVILPHSTQRVNTKATVIRTPSGVKGGPTVGRSYLMSGAPPITFGGHGFVNEDALSFEV